MKKILVFASLSIMFGAAALAAPGDVNISLTPGQATVLCGSVADVDAQLSAPTFSIYVEVLMDSNNTVVGNKYVVVNAPFYASDLKLVPNGNICVLVTKR